MVLLELQNIQRPSLDIRHSVMEALGHRNYARTGTLEAVSIFCNRFHEFRCRGASSQTFGGSQSWIVGSLRADIE